MKHMINNLMKIATILNLDLFKLLDAVIAKNACLFFALAFL